MSDHRPDSELEQRTWELFERALDAAIAAEPGDIAALELGVRVAELLMTSRVISPPRVRGSNGAGEHALDSLLEPQARFVVRVGADLDVGVARELEGLLAEGRRHIAREFGVAIPVARVHSSEDLDDDACEVLIDGVVVLREEFSASDSQVQDVAACIDEIASTYLADFLTREDVADLLNIARRDSPMVVQELVPNMLSLGQVRSVLRNLVKEQVPIRDLSTILNTLADQSVYTKDPHALTEHVRAALGRKICARYQSPDGSLKAFMLSPDAERAIQNAIQLNETGQVLMLDPNTSQAIQNNLAEALGQFRGQILDPVLITPPKIRRHVKALLERNFSKIVVLSYSEIVAGVQIDPIATIEPHRPGHRPEPPADRLSGDEDADDAAAPGEADGWNW